MPGAVKTRSGRMTRVLFTRLGDVTTDPATAQVLQLAHRPRRALSFKFWDRPISITRTRPLGGDLAHGLLMGSFVRI